MQQKCSKAIRNAVASTPEFKKLYKVSFLGILNYAQEKRNDSLTDVEQSRAGHTLSVHDLTEIAADSAALNQEDKNIACFAAMCHDLGHLAFSHTAERILNDEYNKFDHKDETNKIIDSKNGYIGSILHQYGISPERIKNAICGDENETLYWILNGPINIDTIDGITRFLGITNIDAPYSSKRIAKSLGKLFRHIQLEATEVAEIDSFWSIKKGFYEHFLVEGYFADYEDTFVRYMTREYKLSIDKLRSLTESELIEQSGWSSEVFSRKRSRGRNGEPRWKFSIDNNVELKSIEDLKRRYNRRAVT